MLIICYKTILAHSVIFIQLLYGQILLTIIQKQTVKQFGVFTSKSRIHTLFYLKTKNADKNIPTKELTNEALCQMQAYRVCLKENHDMDVDRFIALYVYPDQPAYPVHASGEALTIYENLWTKRLRNFADQQLWQ